MFIDSEVENHTVSILCKVMNVSRSGYYAWKTRELSLRAREDEELRVIILETFTENRSVYGARRLRQALRKKGVYISKRRCSRLMRDLGIRGVSKRKGRPKPAKTTPEINGISDLVNRNFTADKPNMIWFADITYVKTKMGWLYLAVVFDIYSRIVVGWSMDTTMTAKLVDDALRMGVARRQPPIGLLHHTDRGSQYLSLMLSNTLRHFGITPSVGMVRSPWDNAACESLISTIKAECTDVYTYDSFEQAKLDIFDYIEVFYNRIRIHTSIEMMSPMEFEDRYYAGSAKAS